MRTYQLSPLAAYAQGILFTLLLLGLYYLAGTRLVAPLYDLIGWHAPMGRSLTDLGYTLLVLLPSGYMLFRFVDQYMILNKYATAVAVTTILVLTIAVPSMRMPSYWLSVYGCIGVLNLIMATYQDRDNSPSMLIVGLIMGLGCIAEPVILYLLPLILILLGGMRSISVRSILGLGIGIVSSVAIILALSLFVASEFTLGYVQRWFDGLDVYPVFATRQTWSSLPTWLYILLSFGASLSFAAGRYHDSVRQRANGNGLIWVVLYCLMLHLVDARGLFLSISLVPMSILLARGVCMLEVSAHRAVLLVLAVLTLLLIFIS